MCVHPLAIRDINTGQINLVPCGKCIDCRKAYQNEWIFRLSQQMKDCPLPVFVTLTYNDEHLPYGDVTGAEPQSVLCKEDLQKFLKRLRKNGDAQVRHLKYFAVGEYGARKNRCHYHLVIMCPHLKTVRYMADLVDKCWRDSKGQRIGFNYTKYCTEKQVHYVCKYMNKLDKRKHLVRPFRLYSRGLGLNYLSAAIIKYYLETFDRTCLNGKCRISLPRYFRRKLDEISLNHPFLSRAGLQYTDLLPEIVPERGSRYELFRQFQQKLQHLSDMQTAFENRGFESGLPAVQVHYNTLFNQYFNDVPQLVECERNSKRILCDISIKQGLTLLTAVTPLNEIDVINDG